MPDSHIGPPTRFVCACCLGACVHTANESKPIIVIWLRIMDDSGT